VKLLGNDHRLDLLVLQPTPFCNLDCTYCYLPERSATHRISEAVLRRTFEQVFASRYAQKAFTVVWHAGEPLVMPVEFYEGALRLIAELNRGGIEVSHSFQTNGTLITPAWCDFIKKHQVRIGVSVDGPAFLHDAHRKTRKGKGTHDRVMAGIRCLQEHGIEFHTISVLTREALDYPRELFEFFVENGIQRIGFNIEEIEGVNGSSTLDTSEAAEKVRSFMRTFLALVSSSSARLDVREFEGLRGFITAGRGFIGRGQENNPMQIINVDWAGNFSTFSPELLGLKSEVYGDFLLGNILRDDLTAIEKTPKFRRLKEDVDAGVRACRETCEYFGLCGGGSPSNKYFETGSFRSTETMHCKLSKMAVVDVLLENLEGSLGIS
jgi:uncharacterized protein